MSLNHSEKFHLLFNSSYMENFLDILSHTPVCLIEKASFTLATRDDKWSGTFDVFVKNHLLQQHIDKYIREILYEHLSKKFAPKNISIDVRDVDSLVMLDDVRFELKLIESLTEEEVTEEQHRFLAKLLRHKNHHNRFLYDSASFIFNLPPRVDLIRSFAYDINVPAKYELLATHPNYFFVRGDLLFQVNSLKKTVYMSKLREKSDVKVTRGENDQGKIEN